MDDSRTQRTLDALADLYLTGPDIRPAIRPDKKTGPLRAPSNPSANTPSHPQAHSPSNPAGSTHSAANTGPSDSAPLRLPPKLRIRHAPAPSAAAFSQAPAVSAVHTGPARPWREVRQERRDQFAMLRDGDDVTDRAPAAATDPATNHLINETLDVLGDLQGALAEHMHKAQLPAVEPVVVADLDDDPQGVDTMVAREDQDDHAEPRDDGDHHDHRDHAPYAFPAGASRSRDIAASGVMTDEADGPKWRQAGASHAAQAVYLGNLPGFAGPWLAQYAQLLAVRKQRVAIIHIADELAEVQLVSPLGVPAAEPVRQGESIVDLFERLACDRISPLTQWLVHLPTPLSQDSKELGHDFDCWTLLTGADDAAVASGVQWLTKMLDDDRRHVYRQVGVSVMGSDPSRGQEVAKRIDAGSRGLLQQPVALLPSRRQMAPVNIQTIAVFAPAMEMWAEMTAYLSSVDAAQVSYAPSDEAAPATPSIEEAASYEASFADSERGVDSFRLPESRRVSPQRQSPSQLIAKQEEPPITAESSSSHSAAPAVEPVIVQTPIAPAAAAAPISEPEPVQTASATDTVEAPKAFDQDVVSSERESLDYVRWIIPGAVSLEARCPYKPSVQLALDQQGQLHVMAGAADADNQGRSPREMAMDLLEVRQWAIDHLSLLGLTQRQCRFDLTADPVVHLFATDGIAATTMARSLGTSIKLHLLQQAHIGSQSTWVASPLN